MFSYRPLAELLKKNGMNVEELAGYLEEDVGRLKRDLNSGGYISLRSLDKICNRFECSVGDVIQWYKGFAEDNFVEVNWDKILEYKIPLTTLSIKCNLGRATLSNAYNRGGRLKLSTVHALCKTLECNPEELLKRTGN